MQRACGGALIASETSAFFSAASVTNARFPASKPPKSAPPGGIYGVRARAFTILRAKAVTVFRSLVDVGNGAPGKHSGSKRKYVTLGPNGLFSEVAGSLENSAREHLFTGSSAERSGANCAVPIGINEIVQPSLAVKEISKASLE